MSRIGRSAEDLRRTTSRYFHLPEQLRERWRRAELIARIPAVTSWIEINDVPPTPVSVIIATRDRAHRLPRALASVRAQQHSAVEIVVVDNGSESEARVDVTAFEGSDMKVVRVPDPGLSAALNRGLQTATGELVTYLDDDNYMQPLWCKAVAWAFAHFPEPDLVYGARLCEDFVHLDEVPGNAPASFYYPFYHLEPFNRPALEHANYIDANVMAHRRDHPEARFDEDLPALNDWDLALRLTRRRPAIPLPVVACHYTTSEDSRMSRNRERIRESQDLIQRRLARADNSDRRGRGRAR